MLRAEALPSLIGYILCAFALTHAILDAKRNRIQRLLLLFVLFVYGSLLEYIGVAKGYYFYNPDFVMILKGVPLPVSLAWVGIIYSVMIIAERLDLNHWLRIITASLIALSLDWGLDPAASALGLWTWDTHGREFFGVPGDNFYGWFFIPAAFLIAYGLDWDKKRKGLKLYTISEIDKINSLGRKIYTLLFVIPISLILLAAAGLIYLIAPMRYIPCIGLITGAACTVLSTSFLIIWKRSSLQRRKLYNLLPPGALLFISLNYTLYAFIIHRSDLGLLMLLTGIPLWFVFGFTLAKKKTELLESCLDQDLL
jgi:uncharacterized membrane protein